MKKIERVPRACVACGTVFMPWQRDHRRQRCCSSACVRTMMLRGLRSVRGNIKHGAYETSTYSSWQSAKTRCFNPNAPNYARYGERGITMCQRWAESFEAFRDDMGERPEGTSLDRINPNGHYEPANCRWATPVQQANNKERRGFKLDEAAVADIRAAQGSTRAIGAQFGVSHTHVRMIRAGLMWHA